MSADSRSFDKSRPRHTYTRPKWICEVCDEPWPCAERRAAFLQKYAGRKSDLRALLGAFQMDAARDLGKPVGAMQERFVDWTYAPLSKRSGE